MKTMNALLLTMLTIALAAICVGEWRKLADQKAQLAALHGQLDEQSKHVEELEASQKRLATQRKELQRQVDDLTSQVQAQTPAVTAAQDKPTPAAEDKSGGADKSKDKGGFGKMLSQMMGDPEMKKFIQSQQRVMMDQLYGPLMKQLGLTPEEAQKFKDLMADNAVQAAEKASSLMGGGSATNRAELMSSMTAAQQSFNDQVKQLLGDQRYAQYQDYQQTVGERMQLNQFRAQAGSGDNAITDQQTDQLLALMAQEKKKLAAAGQPVTGNGQDPANLEAMFSQEQMDKLLQTQQTLNDRVYEGARAFLTPDQLNSFGGFQTNQLQMMRLGMGMAQKFFTPGQSDGTSQ